MNDAHLKQLEGYHRQTLTLYILLGAAVWSIQHLEDALNTAIAIKNPQAINRVEGDRIRDSNRKLPLGRAIERAENEEIFANALQRKLQDFLAERNWLIHRCMHESVDDVGAILNESQLFTRIKNIELLALSLKKSIEIDMLNFCSSKGREDIHEAVRKSYDKWIKNFLGS